MALVSQSSANPEPEPEDAAFGELTERESAYGLLQRGQLVRLCRLRIHHPGVPRAAPTDQKQRQVVGRVGTRRCRVPTLPVRQS